MRRRLLSLDSRLVDAAASAAIVVDPECPSSSGENNKENRQEKEAEKGILEEEAGTFNKRLSRSRKRLNSAELDYEGTNGNENAGTTGQKSTEEEAMEKDGTDGIQTIPIPIERQQTQQQPEPPMARRGGGRIAYLYGSCLWPPLLQLINLKSQFQEFMVKSDSSHIPLIPHCF
jgi:hypothetical protein